MAVPFERRLHRSSPVKSRDALFLLALLLSPTAHAQEEPDRVVAFSGADFSGAGALNLSAEPERFTPPSPPDPSVWVRSGNRIRRQPHECAIAPPDTFEWGDRDSYRSFNWSCGDASIDTGRQRFDSNQSRSGFDVEEDRLTFRVPR